MLSEQARMKMYASQKRIHKETLDHIHVTCKKGNKKRYQEYAASQGLSLNALIIKLLDSVVKN